MGERTYLDSVCCKFRGGDHLIWHDFKVGAKSVPRDLEKAADACGVLDADLAVAKIAERRRRAAYGILTPRDSRDPELPYLKPVRLDDRLWELRVDLRMYGGRELRIYHSEGYAQDGLLVAMHAHQKLIKATKSDTKRLQDEAMLAAVDRHSQVDADMARCTVRAEMEY